MKKYPTQPYLPRRYIYTIQYVLLVYIHIYINKMFTLNFGNLGRKDKQKQQWAAAVGYLVAIVVALVAPLLQGKGRTGRTTTTRLCCQRKERQGSARGAGKSGRLRKTIDMRHSRPVACVGLLYIYNELYKMMSVRYTWEIFKCLLALCTFSSRDSVTSAPREALERGKGKPHA